MSMSIWNKPIWLIWIYGGEYQQMIIESTKEFNNPMILDLCRVIHDIREKQWHMDYY